MHLMLSILSFTKAPVQIKCFWNLWVPAKLEILMRGMKRKLLMFRCILLKNVSGCGKEGAKYPLFLLI